LSEDTTQAALTGLLFSAYDTGGVGRHAGALVFGKDGVWSSGSYPGYISFWTRPSSGGEVERLVINRKGDVGIGETNPIQRLHVTDTGTTTVLIEDGTSGKFTRLKQEGGGDFVISRSDSGGADIQIQGDGDVILAPATTGGNVGIGTTLPTTLLHVDGNANIRDAVDTGFEEALIVKMSGGFFGSSNFALEASDSSNFWEYSIDLSNKLRLGYNESQKFAIQTDGTVNGPGAITWHTPSDGRLKTDVQSIEDVLDKVLMLRGVSYKWDPLYKPDNQEVRLGLIAQDVEKVFPEAVSTLGDEKGIKAIEYEQLSGVYVEAIKALKKEIDEMKNGALKIKELVVDLLSVKTLRVEYTEYVDVATGDLYCTWIENGEFVKESGACE